MGGSHTVALSEGRVEGVVAKQPKALQRFVGNPRLNIPDGLPFRLTDYLDLVDWTGRQIREDKGGTIDDELPSILTHLDIDEDHWLHLKRNFESSFKTLVGAVHSLRKVCEEMGYQRMLGRSSCEAFY